MNNNSYDRQKKIIEILSMLHEDGDFEITGNTMQK